MVCLDGKDDWIYVTKQTKYCWDLQPELFEDVLEATEFAKIFQHPDRPEMVKVVEYEVIEQR
jgi:hypothetical protein